MRFLRRLAGLIVIAAVVVAPAPSRLDLLRAEVVLGRQSGAGMDTLRQRDPSRPARVAVFLADGFPTVDAAPLDRGVLDRALEGRSAQILSTPEAVAENLDPSKVDVLVLPYGSAFPLEAWEAIRRFLASGGGLVVLGGAPFHQPIYRSAAGVGAAARWMLAARQPTFAHSLLIGPAEPVPIHAGAAAPVGLSEWAVPLSRPTTAWALTVRFATRADTPGEEGAAGPRDAVLRPLAHLMESDGTARGCPLVEIDRLRGPEAGARWVLASSDAALDVAAVRAIIDRALEGAVEVTARPVRAAVDPGETASIRVSVRRPFARPAEARAAAADLVLRDDRGAELARRQLLLSGTSELVTGIGALQPTMPLEPGLYHVEVAIPGVAWHPRTTTTGFWVRDRRLLASGPRLSVSRDWIRADGRVFPIVGTTYMASDVHRKFLFEPNPHLWDRDFAAMARQGVNMVRTGLWTGWSRVMLDAGAVDESVLDALDAYVLTAAKHGIVVCFNFFAFLPPSFGGSNPYLDPRALDGQRELLVHVASRYANVGWIHYDLINEPSYAPPEKLWQTRPIGDAYEAEAWRAWVRARHGEAGSVIRDRWRDERGVLFAPPADSEFNYAMVRGDRHPRKAADFVRFTQDVVAGWAGRLRDVLRAAAGEPLVTLGQDEGGTATRPSPQLHADAVDYTAVHTWWNNDDLLWDGVVTKVPEKPNLVQETGLMRLEDADGAPWRTPEAAAALLERKFAYAVAARSTGAVEWAWNINPYQPIDNESVIGLVRPDGTAKPEMRVLSEFAAFFKTAAPFLDDFEPDPVVVVLPHSRLFAGRPGGMDAVKAVVRVLAERFGLVPTAISELRVTAERLRPARLVIVPVPEMLEDGAARALVAASAAGTQVLVTGAVEGTPYGERTEALRSLGILDSGLPVALREPLPQSAAAPARPAWVTFDAGQSQHLRRASAGRLQETARNVWREPLPLEFAREQDALAALAGEMLKKAGVTPPSSGDPMATRVLTAPKAWLVVLVNEASVDGRRTVEVGGRPIDIPVAAGHARLLLVERPGGRMLAVTPGGTVLNK